MLKAFAFQLFTDARSASTASPKEVRPTRCKKARRLPKPAYGGRFFCECRGVLVCLCAYVLVPVRVCVHFAGSAGLFLNFPPKSSIVILRAILLRSVGIVSSPVLSLRLLFSLKTFRFILVMFCTSCGLWTSISAKPQHKVTTRQCNNLSYSS